MHKFYFNECFSQAAVSFNEFVLLLIATINEYESLVKKDIGVERDVVLAKETEKTIVCEDNLKNAILSIPDKDREVRSLAFSYFTKSPIQFYLQSDDKTDERILEEDYRFESHDAINLAIAKFNNCFLFSIGVDLTVKKDVINLVGTTETLTLDNLYGEKLNTKYIESQIIKINASNLELFEQLKVELKDTIYALAFEKVFKSASKDVQQSIIDCFVEAPKRKLKTPYFPDNRKGGLIKDVTPDDNRKKAKVYELRVYQPEALRVYFYELDNRIYISGLHYKNEYKKKNSAQSKDITKSLNVIDSLMKTNK